MIRSLIFSVLCLLPCIAFTQSFTLPVLPGWTTEEFAIPIEFAPSIPFKGEEHIRFAPGWAAPENEEHWTYCFTWWIEPGAALTAAQVNTYVKDYYAGLVRVNLDSANQKLGNSYQPKGSFKLLEPAKGATQSFEGEVTIFNYITRKQITLHVDVNVLHCPEEQKRAVMFSISPQPKKHRVWTQLTAIREGFRCKLEK